MFHRSLQLLLVVLAAGCLDPYSPHVRPADVNILVVDGSLNISDGTATVALSRAVILSSPDSFPPVTNAYVSVEDGSGNVYALTEQLTGNYQAAGIPILTNARYRLRVVTAEDDEYYSDLITPYKTPLVDSVTWTADDEKLTIRVNSHDDRANSSRYYRWTFEETWNYHAAVLSMFKVVGGSIALRRPDEMVFYCWKTQQSANIIIGSTARLSENLVSQVPVHYIPAGSRKLQMKYSVLVRQRAIDQDEYDFLDQLRKTNESIGGLFDPQPFTPKGNIQRTSARSPQAVGYFSAGEVTSKRVFISNDVLPRIFREIYPPTGCVPPDTLCTSPGNGCAATIQDIHDGYMVGTPVDKGFTLTNARCADCRFEGGVTTAPDFWE